MNWNAIGAIGTAVGSLVTAIAVVIAVIQYKQPLIKKIKITLTSAFPVFDSGLGENYYCITVANTGIRNIVITNVYLSTRKKNLIVNNIMEALDSPTQELSFPQELCPEKSFSVYISYKNLSGALREGLQRENVKEHDKIRILVSDTTSGKHYKRTGMTVKKVVEYGG